MPGQYTTPTRRARIVLLKQLKKTNRNIADQLGISEKTVEYRWKKYKEGKSLYHNSPKTGRPRALQGSDYNRFMQAVEEERWEDVTDLLRHAQVSISRSTTRRYLREAGWVTRRKVRVPLISEKNAGKRLVWARAHCRYTLRFWRKVWFSDESKFARIGQDK